MIPAVSAFVGDHGRKMKEKKEKKGKKRKTGPCLPTSLQRDVDNIHASQQPSIEPKGSYLKNDIYEYDDEAVPHEESKKNHRYDDVENFEYEFPEDFEEEDVPSDDEHINGKKQFDENCNMVETSRRYGMNEMVDHEEVNARHLRMLQGITGIPNEAFGGKNGNVDVVSEGVPESEYNPSHDMLAGNGLITMDELVEGFKGTPGYGKLRKRIEQQERKSMPLQAPLHKEARNKVERKVAYSKSKRDITKWEPLVKRNREAPTLFFNKDTDLGFSTIGAMASEFKPRTQFEKKMASLVKDDKIREAHNDDGSKLLELNNISVEDFKKARNNIARMRSLLFRHEVKMKRIKKIKSKTFRHLECKHKLKAASCGNPVDSTAAKTLAIKQEYKRAEERMTLRHKNHSKWAKRILHRGLDVQDEGTRAAFTEQLHQNALLTRKMKSMRDSSSSSSEESSGEEDDQGGAGSDKEDEPAKILARAREKTFNILQEEEEEEDEAPRSGVLSLPFMVRSLEKRKEKTLEEANLALQEIESSLKKLDGKGEAGSTKMIFASGRRVFGGGSQKQKHCREMDTVKLNHLSPASSNDEAELHFEDDASDIGLAKQIELSFNSAMFKKDSEGVHHSDGKNLDIVVGESGRTRTEEVGIFDSGSCKKVARNKKMEINSKMPNDHVQQALKNHDSVATILETDEARDTTDSEGEAAPPSPNPAYKLPSQAELVHEAFAGDDVVGEFIKDKEVLLNVENPEPEKPVVLPGWGQWTHVQKKKGLPSWMVGEYEASKRKREEALSKRKDAHLQLVIISEKLDKKSEKLHARALPFPYTSKDIYEQSIRMPIGPEFNPATSIGPLTRPQVVKKSGVIINPIKFEEVDPQEKASKSKLDEPKKQKRTLAAGRQRKLNAVAVKS